MGGSLGRWFSSPRWVWLPKRLPSQRTASLPIATTRIAGIPWPNVRNRRLIILREGKEHLLLQVALDDHIEEQQAKGLVWIVPVPARPSETHARVLRGFPQFLGARPVGEVVSTTQTMLAVMAGTQFWTWPLLVAASFGRGNSGAGARAGRLREHGASRDRGRGCSLLDTTTYRRALQDHGISLPGPVLLPLSQYANDPSAFVLFRIADLQKYREASREANDEGTSLGVEIVFPSQTGFFPLIASAGLPGPTVSVVVTTLGFMIPTVPAPSGVSTEHYMGSYQASPEVLEALGIAASGRQERYTRFRLAGPPPSLREDLRFEPGASRPTQLAADWLSFAHHEAIEIAALVVIHGLLSVLAAVATRPVWPLAARPTKRRAALLGLANLGSVLGLVLAALLYARTNRVPRSRGLLYAGATSGAFCVVLLLVGLLTKLVH